MKKEILKAISDTFKRNGKYSATLCTMFAFSFATFVYGFLDFFKHGFNSEVFWAFVTLGAGIKVTDAISKKLTPTIQ